MTLMRSAGSSPAGSYDPFTREALADPAAAHRYLRERCPVHHFDGFGERGFYTVSRHADVDRLFRDVGRWSSEWGQGPIYSREGGLRRRALHRDGATLPDDVLTSLLSAEHDGRRFTNEQLLPLILLLLVGGNETTTSLIGNLVWRLLDLGLWEQVSARPQLRDAAIEESLRYDPPVLGLFRTSTRPTSLHGVEIPPDSKVHGLYASANRDPAAWDDPDTFRLDRDYDDLRRRHLSFGVGLYLCPGAALARREARVALDLLIGRLPSLRLTDQPERTDSFMMWGPKSLRVAWDVPVPGGDS